jgi:hypothetical protein
LKISAAAVTMSLVDEDHLEPGSEPIVPPAEEAVDGLPVLADVRPVEAAPPPPLPAVQAAAAAATGFVAGVATVALMKRHAARKLARAQPPAFRRGAEGLPGVGHGRTFLVHVHMIGRPAE